MMAPLSGETLASLIVNHDFGPFLAHKAWIPILHPKLPVGLLLCRMVTLSGTGSSEPYLRFLCLRDEIHQIFCGICWLRGDLKHTYNRYLSHKVSLFGVSRICLMLVC